MRLFSVELDGADERKRLLLGLRQHRAALVVGTDAAREFRRAGVRPSSTGCRRADGSDDNFRKTQKKAFLLFGMK